MRIAIAVVVVAGCAKQDDCERVADKVIPVMKELGETDPKRIDRDAFIGECRKDRFAFDSPVGQCLLREGSHDAIAACLVKGMSSGAQLHLKNIEMHLEVYALEHTALPSGTSTMPAESCCKASNHKCAVVPAAVWAKDPIWGALDVHIEDETRFQYRYEGDGRTAKVTAVADLACDGHPTTYVLEGSLGDDGEPRFSHVN
jgi:hypothetical protein